MNKREGVIVKSMLSVGLLAGLVLIAMTIIGVAPVSAEEADAPATHMRISPVSTNIKLDPGQEYNGTVKVGNIGSEAFDFRVYASPYSVEDLTYLQLFTEKGNYSKIAQWISFDDEEYKNLKPGKTIEVPYHINVPADPPGGAQHAVIFFETAGDENSTGAIQTVNRLGYAIYATVSGDTREEGELVSLEQKGLYFNPPIGATAVVKNTGNVDFTAIHTLRVETIFGEELYRDSKDAMIIAETSRQIEHNWDQTPLIGLYKVTNEVRMLDEIHHDSTKFVLIIPIWLIIIVIAALLTLIILIFRKISARAPKMNLGTVSAR